MLLSLWNSQQWKVLSFFIITRLFRYWLKLVKKVPTYRSIHICYDPISRLQSIWRNNADRILNADKREVCIEDIASFVEEKSRALSNPIFGKLPFLAKDKKKSQTRGTKSKPEGSGPGPRELSNFSTSSQKSPMDQNKSQEKKSEDLTKRRCLFCNQIHNLVDCPAFAKIPVRERFDFVMKQRLCFSCLRGGHQSRDPTRRSRLHIVTEDMLRWCILILRKTRTSSRHLRMRVFHSFHVSCYRGVYEFQKAPVTHPVSNIVSLCLSVSFFLWVPWAHEHHLKYLPK